MAVIGGRAHLNGITFATSTHVVRGRLTQGLISVKIRRLPLIWLFNVMDKVPFLRGVTKLVKLNLNLFICLIILLCIPWDLIFASNTTTLDISASVWPVFAIYGFVIVALVIFLKRLWQFHGAEHKAFNIYLTGGDLSLNTVQDASRLSERCGTNLVVILLPLMIIQFLFLYQSQLLIYLVSISIGYEIFNLSSKRHRLKPVFIVAGFIQKYIVTAEPTEEQLRVAIATLSKAIECENSPSLSGNFVSM